MLRCEGNVLLAKDTVDDRISGTLILILSFLFEQSLVTGPKQYTAKQLVIMVLGL